MPRTESPNMKARRPADEVALIMGGARLKLKAARLKSTNRLAAEALKAQAEALDDLTQEFAELWALLPDDRRSELLPLLSA